MSEVEHLKSGLLADIEAAETLEAVESLRVGALGKQGVVTALLKTLGSMSAEERLEKGPPIQDLRDELRLLAATVAREVETNRQILRGIIAAGEELIRVLAGAGVGLPDASTAPGAPNGSEGALINRTI